MNKLIRVIEQIGDIDVLLALLKACDETVESVDDLAEYIEDEIGYM